MCQAVGDALGVNQRFALIADVGGGSTLLTLLENGEIAKSQSLRLGSIRLQEMFSTSEESPRQSASLLRQHISNTLSNLVSVGPLDGIDSFVAVGGDARFAAREAGTPTEFPELSTIGAAALDELVERCERHTSEELAKRYGLPFAEAETLNPALLVYQALLHKTKARQMIVSNVSMRDGLLLELAREVTGKDDDSLRKGIIHSATALAVKYQVDLNHARSVADLAVRLFDVFQADHGLRSAPAAVAAHRGPAARGRRIRQQPGAPQAQRIPDRQLRDFRAQSPRNPAGLADCPLPSPQRSSLVAPLLHGPAAGIADYRQQAGRSAPRGRRPDPRPPPPGGRHPLPAATATTCWSPCRAAWDCCWKSAPWRSRATCWKTSTG